MDAFLSEVRHAVRKLARTPGFTLVAVLTLALGIGATSAIFSVVDGVLLRSLPFAEPDGLVSLYTSYPHDDGKYPLSAPDFMSFRAEEGVFEEVVGFNAGNATLTGEGEPAQLDGAWVTDGFFGTLGISPSEGRAFRPDENREGNTDVVMLGHGVWLQRFGGDPQAVGRTVTVNGIRRTVVGVLPPGFDFPGETDLYMPLPYDETFDATTAQGRRSEYISTLARLAPGTSLEGAASTAEALSRRLSEAFPETNRNTTVRTLPLDELLLGDVRTPLLVLLGAVGLVLLIACANVANLLLARAAGREGELAVRTALGADRRRLVTQLLTESVVLGLAGGALGLVLAVWGTEALVAARPEGIPRLDEVGVDATVVAFTTVVALATGILFGLIPAVQATRGDLTGALKEGGRGALAGRGGRRLRSALVVAELSLAVTLLVGAGLLIRSFARLVAVDPGFRSERVLTFDLSLPSAVYDESAEVTAFYAGLLERMEALPGVRSAGAASDLPLSGVGGIWAFEVEGREPADGQDLWIKVVTPEYLRTMGIPLRRGRAFTARDREGAPPVALLNEAAVRRYFPEEDPVGQRITFGDDAFIEVVGVVADVRQFGLGQEAEREVYLPHGQFAAPSMSVALRTDGDPLALARAVRREVGSLDPDLPLEEFRTGEQILSASVAQPRFYATLLTLFAGVALALAAIGIFGVVSYNVVQRTREIGVRMALGADPRSVLRLVVGGALALAALGIALGLAAAFAGTRLLAGLLYGVGAADPLTYAGVAVVLFGVAALASYLPARAATRVDPMTALRTE